MFLYRGVCSGFFILCGGCWELSKFIQIAGSGCETVFMWTGLAAPHRAWWGYGGVAA